MGHIQGHPLELEQLRGDLAETECLMKSWKMVRFCEVT